MDAGEPPTVAASAAGGALVHLHIDHTPSVVGYDGIS